MRIIDRITETRAYIEDEDGCIRPYPRAALPAGAREGDCLTCAGGEWRVDAGETRARRERIKKRLERLKK